MKKWKQCKIKLYINFTSDILITVSKQNTIKGYKIMKNRNRKLPTNRYHTLSPEAHTVLKMIAVGVVINILFLTYLLK